MGNSAVVLPARTASQKASAARAHSDFFRLSPESSADGSKAAPISREADGSMITSATSPRQASDCAASKESTDSATYPDAASKRSSARADFDSSPRMSMRPDNPDGQGMTEPAFDAGRWKA